MAIKRQPPHRRERVATQIHHLLAQAVSTRVKDPRVTLVTVTGVEVTADLSQATVRVSVMGTDEDKDEALRGLDRARGFLRSLLAGSLDVRTVPELHFILDRGLEHARRIDELLTEIQEEPKP